MRWAVLLAATVAGLTALSGWLRDGPVITWQRAVAIWTVILAHIQLAIGVALYIMRMDSFKGMARDQKIYWRYEHVAIMVIVVALITIGRLASRKARTERGKHMRVAIFYLLALLLMIWMMPWPFTDIGAGRTWL